MAIISEENFDQVNVSNNSSIVGNNVTGKQSDYTPQTPGPVPQNILHDYTSYTYRITLFFLTSQDYNNLSANPTSFTPKYSLISSAGGYATTIGDLVAQETRTGRANYNQTLRHPDFQTDFFIDNLSMESVVGLNAKTKASNAIDISFTITEPYGLSLLDRLLSACETSDDRSINYMSQPYLLQVDILANPSDDKLNQLQITNNVVVSKKIAIKLIEMKIKPTGSGTTYAVSAIPYNHSAFDNITASLPVPMTVEAGTVGEFFSSNDELEKLFVGQIKTEEERIEREVEKWIAAYKNSATPSAAEIENQRRLLTAKEKFKVKSLPAAYNGYMEKIKTSKKLAIQIPTRIAFNIPDDEIAKSKIVNAADSSTTDVGMSNSSSAYNQVPSSGKDKQVLSFNAGYSIIDIVDAILSKSEYIKNQLKTQPSEQSQTDSNAQYTGSNDRSGQTNTPKKLKWFKILPTVALQDFDPSTNTYSKTVLYSILPYTAANAYHPNFPKVNSSNVADTVVRVYDYLYTGKNKDIIRLDIDFDSSFYTLITTKGDQVVRGGNDADSDTDNVETAKYSAQITERSFPPVVKAFAGAQKGSVGTTKSTDPDEQIIADLKTSLYSSQRGDALNLKLQIIGDPAFIKQDDVFYNPGSPEEYARLLENRLANNSTRPISDNGQILFDAEQVYVRVNVKNAIDINDPIGIVNKQDILSNGRTTDGSFSGIYKVITVVSEFNRGQFTQTLDLIRIPDALTPPAKPARQTTRVNTNETLDQDAEAKRGIFSNPVIPTPNAPPVPSSSPTQPSQFTQSNQPLTFSDAFAQARKDFGNKPGGVFEWRGKLYQTNLQNEPFVANPTPVYPGANE